MIVAGRAEMTPDPSPEAEAQLHLRYELGVLVSRRYAEAGFQVAYQDVIMGPDLEWVVDALGSVLRQVVVLCPLTEILDARDAERGNTGYGGDWTPEALDRELRESTPRIGLWLDTSHLTVGETVDRILAARGDP
jgi:sugar phosphate isomerase/epimerase